MAEPKLTPAQKKRRAGIVESLTADVRKEAKEAADEALRKRKADELALKRKAMTPEQVHRVDSYDSR